MIKKTADVVIIGAGIIGPSTAFYLSQAGIRNIAIIDAYTAGGEATRATAAMVMHQTGVAETTKLAKLSIDKYKKLKDELGIDIGLVNSGSIVFTTTKTGKEKIEKQATMQNSAGVKTEIVDSKVIEKETRKLINGKDILCGIYCSGDGYINASLAVHGYLEKAKENGTRIFENTIVTKIILDKNNVIGVETDKREIIYTNIVVNCAGAWAKDVANLVGLKVPIKANKKNVAVLENNQFKFRFPIIEDFDFGWYYRPINEGILVGFGFGDWVEDNDRVPFPPFDTQKVDSLKKYIAVRSPRLSENLNIIYTNAGYRPMIDPKFGDGLPIIGPVDNIKGYYNNCGYGEFGITLAAIGGELISQIILNKPTRIDTKPFLLSRFSR